MIIGDPGSSTTSEMKPSLSPNGGSGCLSLDVIVVSASSDCFAEVFTENDCCFVPLAFFRLARLAKTNFVILVNNFFSFGHQRREPKDLIDV